MSFFADTWVGFFAGRDMMRQRGWLASLVLIPRRDLTPEGRIVLAGLRFDLALDGRALAAKITSDAQQIAQLIWIEAS